MPWWDADSTPLFMKETELSPAVQHALLGVVQILEAKDTAGPGHSARVTAYGTRLARAAGLSKAELAAFAFGCLVHDVGKSAVPDQILQKPGRLTELEFQSVKNHPQIGAWLIRPALLHTKSPILDVVLHHHEHFDGSGYPGGMRGKEIPKWARICSIADAWDVMTSPRAYRLPFSLERAVAELQRCSGTQFDPELTNLFLEQVVPTIEEEPKPPLMP